jgi:transcriptional regulator with XRE-family HTH domain
VCQNVGVENIGDAWHKATAERIGKAVAKRRHKLGMTAQQLAERCKDRGAPIHRTTITKIENGRARFDVGELLILAAALDIPPALLLFPTFPDGTVELLPGLDVSTLKARECLCGDAPIPIKIDTAGVSGQITRPNRGVGLVGMVARRARIEGDLGNFRRLVMDEGTPTAAIDGHRRTIELYEQQLVAIDADISDTKAALWGDADA